MGATRTVTGSKFLRDEIMKWLADSPDAPRKAVHLVHGEPSAIDALAATLRDKRGHDVHVPEYMEKVEL
jgi:predicted metal-dependent RNase